MTHVESFKIRHHIYPTRSLPHIRFYRNLLLFSPFNKMADETKRMVGHFNKMADSYEKDTRGLTRKVASHFLSTLTPPIGSTSVVHDNAAGPGIVTFEILDRSRTNHQPLPAHIVATDITPGMIDALKASLDTRTDLNTGTVEAYVRDAQDLGFEDGRFTHSFTCFGIFACPEPGKAAAEIYRTLQPGGVAVVTTWKYAGTMDIIRRISKLVRPDQPTWHPISPDWEHDWKLRQVLAEGGFHEGNIEITEYAQKSGAENVESGEDATEDIAQLFKSPFSDMAKHGWSEEETAKWDDTLRNVLTDEERKTGIGMVAWIGVARK